jgi:hypothetical protein
MLFGLFLKVPSILQVISLVICVAHSCLPLTSKNTKNNWNKRANTTKDIAAIKNVLTNNSLMLKTNDLTYCMVFPAYYVSITSYGTLNGTKNCETLF